MPRRFLNGLDGALDAAKLTGQVALARLAGLTDAQIAAANKDGAAGTPSLRTLGAGAAQAAAGNHLHVATNYSSHADGGDQALPNNATFQRIGNSGGDLGANWQMQGTWWIYAQLLVRADSQNWTTVEARIQLYRTNGSQIDANTCAGYTQVHLGASSDGAGWRQINMGRIIAVTGGETWMPRLEARTTNAFGGVLSKGYPWTHLSGYRLDHGPGY